MNCLFTALDFCNDDLSPVMPSTLSRETHMSNSDTKLIPWIPLVFGLQVQLQKASKATTTKFFNFSQKKRINHDIFGQKLRMEDVSLIIYFLQIVIFCAIIFSYTTQSSCFCENSNLNLANFTDENFTPAQKYFTLVPLVTKSMSVKLGKGSKEWKKKHI